MKIFTFFPLLFNLALGLPGPPRYTSDAQGIEFLDNTSTHTHTLNETIQSVVFHVPHTAHETPELVPASGLVDCRANPALCGDRQEVSRLFTVQCNTTVHSPLFSSLARNVQWLNTRPWGTVCCQTSHVQRCTKLQAARATTEICSGWGTCAFCSTVAGYVELVARDCGSGGKAGGVVTAHWLQVGVY
ncbi:hypothetical protein EDC01DRAFT_627836 [Geopyxis carbonaria]|nr:hypothetical protein EDC01DRAFT_627836 [Geopyxis carbonaria]